MPDSIIVNMNVMKRIVFILLALFLVLSVSNNEAFSQEAEPDPGYKIGLFAGYSLNYYKSRFVELPGIPNCCPLFEQAFGSGYLIGLTGDYRLYEKLSIGLKLGMADLSAPFKSVETVDVRVEDRIVAGKFQHLLNVHIQSLLFQPYISYNIFGSAYINIGADFGYMYNRRFDQKEQITEPSDRGVFVDSGSRIRNINSGVLPVSKSLYIGASAGFGYELPLNREGTLKLVPEFNFTAGFTEIVENIDWKINQASALLSVKYSPPPPKKIIFFEEYRYFPNFDTVTVVSASEKPNFIKPGRPTQNVVIDTNFSAGVIVFSRTETRTDTLFLKPPPTASVTIGTKSIAISAQYVSEAFPLLPIVFFDSASAEFNKSYYIFAEPKEFSEDKILSNPVEFHRNLLNSIGVRMRNYPNSAITIRGAADSATERNSCALARSRAESIKRHLIDVWEISPERIKIETDRLNCSPKNPTQTQTEMGWADNRRAEISSATQEVLAPITRKRFLEATSVTPPVIEINLENTNFENVKVWKLSVSQNNAILFSKEGDSAVSEIKVMLSSAQAANLSGEPLSVEFYIQDIDGLSGSAFGNVEIQKEVSEYEVERISLVLFDVGSALLDASSEKQIKEFVRDLDERTARIRVVGYTDMLGNEEVNRQLSSNRAKNTQSFIKKLKPNALFTEAVGVSAESFPPGIISYFSPAERFLSRTVQIEIIKKMK